MDDCLTLPPPFEHAERTKHSSTDDLDTTGINFPTLSSAFLYRYLRRAKSKTAPAKVSSSSSTRMERSPADGEQTNNGNTQEGNTSLPLVPPVPAAFPAMQPNSLTTSSLSYGSSTYSTLTGSSSFGHQEEHNQFVLLFNRSTGSPKVHYLSVDTRRKSRLMPRVSVMTLTKVKDVVGYRVVVLDNNLYIIGGRNLESGAYLGHCYRFKPDNSQWSRVGSLRRPRSRFTATALEGFIYVTGGEIRGGAITDSVECYDPVTDCWTDMRSLPKPRADHAACVCQGRLFISGGVGETRRKHPIGYFWQYESQSDFWSQAYGTSLLPHNRERHCMVEHKGKIYILGGLMQVKRNRQYVDTEDPSLTSFECSKGNIDTRITGMWDESHPIMTTHRCMATAFLLGHNIWMIGGYNYTEERGEETVQYYNIRKKKWKTAFSMGVGNFNNIDSCILRVPQSNRQFNHLAQAMHDKWTLW